MLSVKGDSAAEKSAPDAEEGDPAVNEDGSDGEQGDCRRHRVPLIQNRGIRVLCRWSLHAQEGEY